MENDETRQAVSIEVSPDKASAHVSEGALSKIGQAAAWLFPKHDAKTKITSAVAARVSSKIEQCIPLDAEECIFIARVFGKEARTLANMEQVSERVQKVLPEVETRVSSLPEISDGSVKTNVFMSRAETLAGEVSEGDIRDLFARVLAGELCRPGSFSLRTLDVIRSLDPQVAKGFQFLCNYACKSEFIFYEGASAEYLAQQGLIEFHIMELRDAGLIGDGAVYNIKFDSLIELPYGDRILRATYKPPKEVVGISPNITVLRFTHVGRDIARVLPFKPDYEYFSAVLNTFKGLSMFTAGDRTVEWTNQSSQVWTTI